MDSLQNKEMVFIVGMGRSGTTMLTTMLNVNKQVVACPENEFILFTAHHFKNADFTDQKIVDGFVKLFNYRFSKTISFWRPTNNLKEKIIELKDKSFASVCKQVYLCYPFTKQNQCEVTCIVDKNPVYSLYIDELNRLFPKAKYIVLTRDYRDNCASRKKVSGKNDSIYVLANSWNYFYECIFKSIKKNNLNYIHIRYEDLVNHSSETLSDICQFLNIPFSDDMLHFQDLSKEMKVYVSKNLSSEEQEKLTIMHHNLENNITNTRVDTYKNELSEHEVSYLDVACHEFGTRFNYSPISNNKLSILQHIKHWISKLKIQLYYKFQNMIQYLPLTLKLKK